MEAPGYWDDVERSQAGMKELNSLKEEKESFERSEEHTSELQSQR